jgi:predicted PolB exonuclease-like 3'-5' exonuclease
MNCLIFDIETIPDTELGAQLLDLDGIAEADIAKAMFFQRAQETGSEFLPLYQQRVVAISVALRSGDDFSVWTLGDEDSDEAEQVRRFYDGIERYQPVLVSWNGSGFDLPVLHYRALKHGIQAPAYWETGDNNRDYRFNNYLSRYHWRHVDVMDVLAGFQPRAKAKLDAIATMLGFPGKMGMSGDKVWDTWLAGGIRQIRDYCETDVLNTYLVYLHFQHMRGKLDDASLQAELELVRATLAESEAEHMQEFLTAWSPVSAD